MLTLALKILTSLKQTAEFFNALGKIYKAFSSHEKYQAYRLSSIQEASGWSATLFSYCGGMNLLLNLIKVKLSLGKFPDQWKLVNVCPVYKSDDPTLPKNYRPISLLCIISKCLERCVFNHCYTLISPQLYHLQHGFLRGWSIVIQLLQVYHELIQALAKGKEIDIAYLDFAKAFDKVPHCALLNKLSRFGIPGQQINWFQSYLSDRYRRVALQGTYSDALQVLSCVLPSREGVN